jgi:chromosome segregation ATPase
MYIIAVDITLIGFIALPLVAIILGVTIYFFLESHKTLRKTLKAGKSYLTPKKEPAPAKKTTIEELEERFQKARLSVPKTESPVMLKKAVAAEEHLGLDLKSNIVQQQKLLDTYLQKIEELENEGKQELNGQIHDLEREINKLHIVIDKKDAELEELQQEASAAQKMAAKIEEVYQEFDQLQEKMATLEKQAGRANNLAIELEDTKHAYEQVHQELVRKLEKLEEVLVDNQRMRQEMDTLEDKLSEANLQRQQLHKKVQFLTDLNNDMQSIADANKKLQTEIRRIGELESMLNLMSEERELLLRTRNANTRSGL